MSKMNLVYRVLIDCSFCNIGQVSLRFLPFKYTTFLYKFPYTVLTENYPLRDTPCIKQTHRCVYLIKREHSDRC